jgi:hypothetical protein
MNQSDQLAQHLLYITVNGMKFPPFLHSHLRLTLLGTPPNRVFLCTNPQRSVTINLFIPLPVNKFVTFYNYYT